MRKILSISLIGCAFVAILYSSTTIHAEHDVGELQLNNYLLSFYNLPEYSVDAAFITPYLWHDELANTEYGYTSLDSYENYRKLQEFKKPYLWLNRIC